MSLRPEHHVVQGFARNDHFGDFLRDHQHSNIPITQHSDVFLTMEERELRFLEEQKLL